MKTRAEHAREYLSAKLVDRDTNFGMNEAYRTALDDMVMYIDLPDTECNHDVLSRATTLQPILKPISRAKDGKPNARCTNCGEEMSIVFENPPHMSAESIRLQTFDDKN